MARRKTEVVGIAIGFDDGRRDPVAPESYNRSQSRPNIDWNGLVGAGENSNGFRAVTPNGTASDNGNGVNQEHWGWGGSLNGDRWNGRNLNWNKTGRANRTGE